MPKVTAEQELKSLKKTVNCASDIIETQEKVKKKYHVSPYDQNFPVDKIKDTAGYKAVEAINDILRISEEEQPEFISGLLISRRHVSEFYYQLDQLCVKAIRAEKHQYCDMQSFHASNESMRETFKTILNHCTETVEE